MDSETYQWHPTLEQNCMGIEAKSVTGKLTYRHSVLLEKAFVEGASMLSHCKNLLENDDS